MKIINSLRQYPKTTIRDIIENYYDPFKESILDIRTVRTPIAVVLFNVRRILIKTINNSNP